MNNPLRFLISIVWGAVLGAASVLLHDAYFPFGLILGLLGTGVGIWVLGKECKMRGFKVLAAVAWAYVAMRGGAPGVGGELLVQGNTAGDTLIYAGVVVLAISILLPV